MAMLNPKFGKLGKLGKVGKFGKVMGGIGTALSIISTLIYVYSLVESTIRDQRAAKALANEQEALVKLQTTLRNHNQMDSKSLSTLNHAFNHLSGIRQTIDPRLIPKIDNAMGKINTQITGLSNQINHNAGLYDTALSMQGQKTSIYKNMDNSSDIGKQKDNIRTDASLPFNNNHYELKITES